MSSERLPGEAGIIQPVFQQTEQVPVISIVTDQAPPITGNERASIFDRLRNGWTTAIAVGAATVALVVAPSPKEYPAYGATTKVVEIGMPFDGKWGSTASGSANTHPIYGSTGQFAEDLMGNAVDVRLKVDAPDGGTISFKRISNWTSNCKNEAGEIVSGGEGIKVEVLLDGASMGMVSYAHLDGVFKGANNEMSNGMILGKTKKWDKSSCYAVSSDAGVHTHFEANSDSGNYACYYDRAVTTQVPEGTAIARIGKTAATGIQQACTEIPSSGNMPPVWPAANLYEIQNWNSPTGRTEIKELPAATNYQSWGNGYTTNDSWHPGGNVDYGMGDFNGDGAQDIIKIQHQGTASGMTEARVFNGADRFTAGNPLVTPDGHHGENDVDYVVADYNRDGRPDIYRIMHWNTGSGKTEVRVLDGATNYSTWLTPNFVTPDGWHGGEGADYAASTCGTTNHPDLFVVLHQGTTQGRTEVKRLDGPSNYANWNGGWNTIDGEHSGDDVNYTAGDCNQNTGLPNIYTILHKNTVNGHTEVKRMDGSIPGDGSFSQWNGGWVTPDGEHSSHDVDFVMAQRNN